MTFAGAKKVEEKTEFSLILNTVSAENKISVLKVICSLTGLGLKEAKESVESAPKQSQESLAKNIAEEAKKQIENVGGKASIV